MSLLPRRPAGRANRKALVFAAEILRLRAEGYSFEAIRDALADAGVTVNASTVRREALRCGAAQETQSTIAANVAPAAIPRPGAPLPSREPPPAHLVASESRSGREVAEVFTRGHVSNPLLRKESNR